MVAVYWFIVCTTAAIYIFLCGQSRSIVNELGGALVKWNLLLVVPQHTLMIPLALLNMITAI